MTILKCFADQMQWSLHGVILDTWMFLLSSLFCLNTIVLYCNWRVNISSIRRPTYNRVNMVHFKGAHLDYYDTYMMKLTFQSNWLMCHTFVDLIFVDKCKRVIPIFWKLDYFHLFGFRFLLLKRCLHCWIGYYQITNPAVFKWCFYVSDRRLPQSWFWVCAQPMRDGVTIRYTCKPRISPVVKFVSQFQPNKQIRHL